MRRRILIVLLSLGALGGYASGIYRVTHGGDGHHGCKNARWAAEE